MKWSSRLKEWNRSIGDAVAEERAEGTAGQPSRDRPWTGNSSQTRMQHSANGDGDEEGSRRDVSAKGAGTMWSGKGSGLEWVEGLLLRRGSREGRAVEQGSRDAEPALNRRAVE